MLILCLLNAGVGNHADGFWILDGGGERRQVLINLLTCMDAGPGITQMMVLILIQVLELIVPTLGPGLMAIYYLVKVMVINGVVVICRKQMQEKSTILYLHLTGVAAHLDTNLDFGPWGEMYNNISWKDRGGFFSSGAGDARCGIDPAHVIYRNNLVYKPRDPDDESAQAGFKMCDYDYPIYVEQDHNTWIQSEDSWATMPNPDYTVTDDDFKLPHDSASIVNQLMAKRKLDGSLPDITCFKLKDKPGGNIIDGGIDVGLPFNGSAPDLGAFEYSSISIEITFPSDGIQISPDQDITIIAMAEDTENTISEVKFYTDNKAILLGSGEPMESSEWQITWRWNTTGSHDLRAVAFNNQGDSATSSVINVLVKNNEDPSIEITSPSNNSEFTAPANITITINAKDADGSVSKVEFFNQDVKIGEKLSAPWSFTWNNVPEGSYVLTAVATDNLGAKSTSRSISVIVSQSVNIEPTVEITSPADQSELTAPANITITTNAKDADGSVSKVEFFNQDVKIGEKLSAPWSFTWNNVPEGSYVLTAVATDNLGAKSTSRSISVIVSQSVNIEPTVEITSPADQSELTAPANITITTNAKDADGSVSKVEFFNQDVKIGEKLSAPWSFTWNNVPEGSYVLTAVATDNLGAKSTSRSISVIVSQSVNIEPTVEITSPADQSEFTAPANITITTNAKDADGSVSKVEFFNQDVKIGEKLSAPWSFTWNNVPEGSYVLTAVATDNLGAKSTSRSISVIVSQSVNIEPTVEITSPADQSELTAPANITITTNAQDADGSVSKVEFFNQDVKIGEKLSAPWSFTWNEVTAGSYILTAVATDNLGATSHFQVNIRDCQ